MRTSSFIKVAAVSMGFASFAFASPIDRPVLGEGDDASELIAEEMTLQELRHARKITQVRLAKQLGIGQDGVSKLEKRADLMISTLRKTVEAMGGSLSLVAQFPDRGPVLLSGIAED